MLARVRGVKILKSLEKIMIFSEHPVYIRNVNVSVNACPYTYIHISLPKNKQMIHADKIECYDMAA